MQSAGLGLTEVPTDDLKALLQRVHRGHVPSPLEKSHLLSMGMNRIAENGGYLLVGLDVRALRSLLTCVISERLNRTQNSNRV